MSKKSIIIILMSFAFLITLSVCAKEYELTYQPNYLAISAGQNLIPMIRPDEKLTAEPKYRSLMTIYATAILGEGEGNKYTLVFDESRGTGRGYDILYVDRNPDSFFNKIPFTFIVSHNTLFLPLLDI